MSRLLVAWMSFIVALGFFGLDFARWTISGLALTGLILLAVWLWGIGGFKRSFWIADDPYDATTSLDELEEQHR